MAPRGRGADRQEDVDVAFIIDATLDPTKLEIARNVAEQVMRSAGRAAIVLSGEHTECATSPSHRSGLAPPPSPFSIKAREFSNSIDDQVAWIARELSHVTTPYMDGPIECALQAACKLDWRLEARKRLYVMGIALPHHHDGESGLLLRTGVACPRSVHWRAQMLQLQSQGIQLHAATAAPEHATGAFESGFLGMLHRSVWSELNARRPPDLLTMYLADHWTAELIS